MPGGGGGCAAAAGEDGKFQEGGRGGTGGSDRQTDANGLRLPVFHAEVYEALQGTGGATDAKHHAAGVC